MFEQSLLDVAARNGRRPWTLAVSTAAQCGLVGLMIVVPMLFTEAGPRLMQRVTIGPPLGEPSPPSPSSGSSHRTAPQSEFVDGRLLAPGPLPDSIYTPAEQEFAISESIGPGVRGLPEGLGGKYAGGTGTLMPTVEAPPQPKPKPPQAVQQIRVTTMEPAMVISRPQLVYPQLAKAARIQGVVRLEAIISKAGTIERLQVLSGHPTLIQAALDAVSQWRYRPTILNGEPVEVVTTIDVHFTLSQ